jgi:uncharacterized protein
MRTLLALMVACSLGTAAQAGPLQDAQAAYDRGKYAVALDLWQPLAEQGDPDAQTGLGNMYLGGYGVARDEASAMVWFRKAAEQGHANGRLSLGSLYYVRKEYGTAATWYRQAAEQGNAVAEIRLARQYADGMGLPRDNVQALKWFTIAAARAGDSYARTNAAKGRDAMAMKMTPGQIDEAERLAREWKPSLKR